MLQFSRNFGFSTSPVVYHLTTTVTGPGGMQFELKIELTEQFGTTTFKHSATGPGFSHPWYNNATIYEENFVVGGDSFIFRYQAYSTQPAGIYDDVIYAIYPATDYKAYEVPTADSTEAGVINVMSYNVYMRPTLLFPNDGQTPRSQHIHDYVHNMDAIIFQEVFDDPSRSVLLANLASEYPYQSSVVNDPASPLEDGGVLIVSKWPIEAEDQFLWGNVCWQDDCTATKGIKYARINKMGQKYHIFGTHMDAFNDLEDVNIRKQQLVLWHDWIDSKSIPANEPVLMGGDFNIDKFTNKWGEYDTLWGNFEAMQPLYTGWPASWDSDHNYYLRETADVPEYLDYILPRTDHKTLVSAENSVLMLRSNHIDMFRHFDLSDHQAVWGRFDYRSPVTTTFSFRPDLNIRVFPNPVNASIGEFVNFRFTLSNPGRIQLIASDLLGRTVFELKTQGSTGENQLQLDATAWPSGVYLLKLSTETGQAAVARIVVQ